MILVTWNCCRGTYVNKVPLLDRFGADIAIVQECSRPRTESDTCLWFGDNPKQGIAVVARPPYTLARAAQIEGVPKFVVPVTVRGPRCFTLFAVWSKGRQEHDYVAGIVRAVELYRDVLVAGPAILAGDFNSNGIWDRLRPDDRNHSALVSVLDGLGIVSAYHHWFGEPHGGETRPTYYFRWSEQQPFHIDYCFLPRAWLGQLRRVEVGPYEEWQAHSDHRPLLVELASSQPG